MKGIGREFRELLQYREFLLNLVSNELKLRYRNSVLGFFWTILNPLFYLLILAVVFSKIIKFEIEHYTIFLLSGLTSWMMIQQTVTIATASVVNNQAMIKRIYVPKMAFPLSNVLARYIDHLVLTLILFVFMILYHIRFTWYLLLVPLILLMHFFFSLGLSLVAAVVNIKIRDIQHIVAIIFQALFYVTPIIYSTEVLPEKYRPFFILNPFYYFVESFRFPVYYSSFPPAKIFLVALFLAVFSFAAGFYIFYKKEKYFVFYLS